MDQIALARGNGSMKGNVIRIACLAFVIGMAGCTAVSRNDHVEPVVVPVAVGGAQISMRGWVERYADLTAMPLREARQHYRQRRKELETYECGEGAIEILMLLTRPDFAGGREFAESENLLNGCDARPGWAGSDVAALAPLLLKQAALLNRHTARERATNQELKELRRQVQALKEVERSLQR